MLARTSCLPAGTRVVRLQGKCFINIYRCGYHRFRGRRPSDLSYSDAELTDGECEEHCHLPVWEMLRAAAGQLR